MKIRLPTTSALAGALALTACGGSDVTISVFMTDSAGVEIVRPERLPSLLDPRFLWSATVELELPTAGDDPGAEPVIYNPISLLPLGGDTVLLTDQFGDHVFVILDATTGEVASRFGRRGSGPGELRGGVRIVAREDGGFLVFDGGNRKLLSFGSDHEVEAEVAIDFAASNLRTGILGGREVLVERLGRESEDRWRWDVVRIREDGEPDPLFELLGQPGWTPTGGATIQDGRPLWVALEDVVVATRTDLPFYNVFDGAGTLIRRIELPLTRRVLTERDIESQVRIHGPIARSMRPGPVALTNEMYVFNDSTFGSFQSSMWRAAEDGDVPIGTVVWRLLTSSGRYQGAFQLPQEFRPLHSTDGVMWGVRTDATGIPVLERRRLGPPAALQD